ncbi:hypothetical protein EUTSA_v10003299mg [Eutrema salsugineum]|uniref:Uncharacterized protein n=1 Tax=Eutrema salsugineum TaxID=72664 RepID=V4NF53_EUTSA|nr:hypothetical protein EUTSA_v10003299mg [Eutrema salsugineum]
MGFWSMTDLTKTAPAKTLRPVASCVITIGPIVVAKKKRLRIFGITQSRIVKKLKKKREKSKGKIFFFLFTDKSVVLFYLIFFRFILYLF